MMTPAEQASERNAEDDIALSRLWPFARAAVPYWIARAERAEARLAECERERDQARRDCDDLHNELGRLHGHVFSKRDYHAMLARIENTQERAVKAEAEVRELREEITRLRAALESRKESMDARNLHDPAR
jgi:peptidoglycan hydrolase CwlO-like protein